LWASICMRICEILNRGSVPCVDCVRTDTSISQSRQSLDEYYSRKRIHFRFGVFDVLIDSESEFEANAFSAVNL
jgi:hypothetical protein